MYGGMPLCVCFCVCLVVMVSGRIGLVTRLPTAGFAFQGGPQGFGTFLTIFLCCADVYSFETEHTLLTADGEDVLNSA